MWHFIHEGAGVSTIISVMSLIFRMCQCFVLTGLKSKTQRISPFQFLHRKTTSIQVAIGGVGSLNAARMGKTAGAPGLNQVISKTDHIVVHSCRFSYSLFLQSLKYHWCRGSFLASMQNDYLYPEISDVFHFWLSHKFTTTRRRKAAMRRHETISSTLEHFEGQEPAHDSNDASLAATLISALLYREFPSTWFGHE